MAYSRDLVIHKVQSVFPSHDPAEILALLDTYGTETYERERERVQLAVLKLSKGDIDRLHKFVTVAKRDYRDALAWAEYPSAMRIRPRESDGQTHEGQETQHSDLYQYLSWLQETDTPDMSEYRFWHSGKASGKASGKQADAGKELSVLEVSMESSGYIQVREGLRLYYRTLGDGPQKVIIPDAGWLADDFGPLVEGRTLVFYHMRGRGGSDAVTDASQVPDGYEVRDLESVRLHLGIERMSLIGWSMSGGTVAQYAMAHPAHVERLVLMCPISLQSASLKNSVEREEVLAARIDPDGLARLEELKATNFHLSDPVEYCHEYQKVYSVRQFGKPHALASKKSDQCQYPNEWPRNLLALYQMHPPRDPWDWRSEVSRLEVPVLVIHGEEDTIPLASSEEWASTLPDAHLLVIPGVGHFPHIEAPDNFFPAVNNFLQNK